MKMRHLVLGVALLLALFAIIAGYLAKNQGGINLATIAGCLSVGAFLGYLLGLLAHIIDSRLDQKQKGRKPGAGRFLLDSIGKGFNSDLIPPGLDGMKMVMRYMLLTGSLVFAIMAGFAVVLGIKGEEGPLLPFCFSFLVLFCYSFIFIVDGLDQLSEWLQDAEDAFGRLLKVMSNRVIRLIT